MVVVEEDVVVTMEKDILAEVTLVVVGTRVTLEIIVDKSNQTIDLQRGMVMLEETQAVLKVVAMDLVVEVVDMVAEVF